MKVIVTGKGEGFVDVRFEAVSPIEAMLLAVCPIDEGEIETALKCETEQVFFPTKKDVAWLTFYAWKTKVHEIVQK